MKIFIVLMTYENNFNEPCIYLFKTYDEAKAFADEQAKLHKGLSEIVDDIYCFDATMNNVDLEFIRIQELLLP